jgi:ABC-2 type transport system permease protein
MKSLALARRNFLDVWRDPVSLGLTIGLPVFMLLVLQLLAGVDAYFTATSLAAGVVLFGFVMLMFSAAMTLSRDRESAFFSRLLTTPLRPNDFVFAYSIPYVPVAILQGLVLFGVGFFVSLEIAGSVLLVLLVLLTTAILYIGLGMIFGSLFSYKTVPFLYAVVLMLTIFGGAWMDLDAIGGPIQQFSVFFPFAHAIDATREVMINAADFGAIATDFFWVLGYTVAAVAIGVVVFRRRMIE